MVAHAERAVATDDERMNRIELLIFAARIVGVFVALAFVGWFVSRRAARNGSETVS